MILKASYFFGQFEKIAQNITEITHSTSSRSKSSLSSGNSSGDSMFKNRRRDDTLNLQSTISKAREKADLQPLHKDTGTIYKPADSQFSSRMRNKQEYLGNIEDKRITHHHLRNR